MDLRDLRYFETIAELQHVGRASARLHRTQPALTGSVRRLERECGVALLEKAGRGIRPTAAGEVLQAWARTIRLAGEDAKREMAALGTGLAGTVRLGIVPTAAQFLLPAVARRLLQEAPDVTLVTVAGLIDSLKPKLRAGEIDLMIGTESADEPGFVSRPLAEDAIVVAASADHPIFEGRPTFRDLTRHRWALQPPGAPTRDWLDRAFDRRRLPRPRVQVEASMLLVLPALIAETGLLSFVSRHHLAGKGGAAVLQEVPVRGAVMRRRLVVTHREKGYLPPAATRLVELFAASRGRRR
jgi:DNA-binding transcriptional LysR family regulator